VKKPRLAEDPDSANAAYLRALRWLTARELSENDVRARLVERGYTGDAVSLALERLRRDGTVDDRRGDARVHFAGRCFPHEHVAIIRPKVPAKRIP